MGKWLVASVLMLLSSSAFAELGHSEIEKLSVAQNGKSATKEECAKAAGKRKGDVRKAFIEGCLRSTHKPKRSSCTEKAKEEGIHGAEREQFMEKCRRGQQYRNSRD
ncbi:MAG: hypothetical protein ACO1NO_02080 [Burkholderiaceae bacterium]